MGSISTSLNNRFFNLQSLVLREMDHLRYRGQLTGIARILVNSPHLRLLALSHREFWGGLENYLERVCDKFEALGGTPLNLVSIELGNGFEMNPPRHSRTGKHTATATYLNKMANTRHLKSLSFDGQINMQVAWGTFTAEMFPNLEFLTLSSEGRFLQDVFGYGFRSHFLSADAPEAVKELMKRVMIDLEWLTAQPIDGPELFSFGGVVLPIRPQVSSDQFPTHTEPNRRIRLLHIACTWDAAELLLKYPDLEVLWVVLSPPSDQRANCSSLMSDLAMKYFNNLKRLRYLKIEVTTYDLSNDLMVRFWKAAAKPMPQTPGHTVRWEPVELAMDEYDRECPRGFWRAREKKNKLFAESGQEGSDDDGPRWLQTGGRMPLVPCKKLA